MAASKRLYQELAQDFQRELGLCDTEEQVRTVEALRDRIATTLSDDNPRFNVTRFKEACEL